MEQENMLEPWDDTVDADAVLQAIEEAEENIENDKEGDEDDE